MDIDKIVEKLMERMNNYGINKKSKVDIERVVHIFNIMFSNKKEIKFIVTKDMIKEINALRKKLGLEEGNYKEGEERVVLFG